MYKHLIILFLSLLPALLAAQSDVQVQFDSNLVETGELFNVHISVPRIAGKPQQLDMQAWEADSIHLQSQSGWKPDGERYVNSLSLITFDADTLQLSPLRVDWSSGQRAFSDSSLLMVIATPSPSDINDIEDIKDIYREKAKWTDYLFWIALMGGLLLAAMLATWYLKNRKPKSVVTNRVLELPPHELALKKLEVLGSKQLWQKGHLKPYYAELTYIIREYLQKKYQIPALESVSSEILAALDRTQWPERHRAALAQLLQEADIVKFAKGVPAETYHAQAFQEVKQMIEA
jgi:hypothetical protein